MESQPNRPTPRRTDGLSRRVVRLPATAKHVNMQAAMPHPTGPFVYQPARPKSRRLILTPKWKKGLKIGGGILGLVALVILLQLAIAYLKIFQKNSGSGSPALSGDISRLRGEGDGRVNILLLGIGGEGHEGANLSDTIIVASIDPKTKDVAMLSLPRDLWVSIPNCIGACYAKINAAYAYGEMYKKKIPGGGAELAKQTVSKILDLPIHYYGVIDFSGFRQAIDAVGGIDVTVEKSIYDPFYPCEQGAGYCPFSIKAGPQHLNGTVALKYTRSRYTTSDFDRAARQQKVLVALRQKTMDAHTLTNPAKIFNLIGIIGSHFKTDFQPGEIKQLAAIAKDIDPAKIVTKVLDTSAGGLLVDHSGDGRGYIELPRSGDWDEIRAFVHSIFVDGYLREEGATVEVQNGTSREGLATAVAKLLRSYNYNVIKATTADQKFTGTVIYDYTGGKKPVTIQYLEKRFGVKAQRVNLANPDTDIKIILGADYRGTD